MLCTQCGHANPDGASHCASCAAPLPAMSPCPSCHELVSTDAYFCAHCGTPLKASDPNSAAPAPASQSDDFEADGQVPPTEVVNLVEVPPAPTSEASAPNTPISAISHPPDLLADDADLDAPASQPAEFTTFPETNSSAIPPRLDMSAAASSAGVHSDSTPHADSPPSFDAPPPPPLPLNSQPVSPQAGATQIQQPMARLIHVRSDTSLSIPLHLDIVHVGKPNERVPPDIDVSGFPDSDVVSRVHADLRLEADGYYLQDSGSANGTYVNNQALRTGDRYRLRTGDRVSLGKEDKVSFIFHAG